MSSPDTSSEQTTTNGSDRVNGSGPAGGSPIGGLDLGKPNFPAIISRAKKITLEPAAAWDEIRSESSTIESIYKSYYIYLAAIPVLGTFLGHLSTRGFFGNFFGQLVSYAVSLAGVYLAAMLIEFLAPKFEGGASRTEAFKLAAYAATPAQLVGVFYIIPILVILSLPAALYSVYVFYLGIEPTVRVAGSKRIGFMLALAACGIVIGLAVGMLGLWKLM